MMITHEDRLADYYEILFAKYESGRLDEAKYESLLVKLDEWAAHAERRRRRQSQ